MTMTRHTITGLLAQTGSKHLERYVSVDCDKPYPHEVRLTVRAAARQDTDDALNEALEPFLRNGMTVAVTATLEDGALHATTDDMRIEMAEPA